MAEPLPVRQRVLKAPSCGECPDRKLSSNNMLCINRILWRGEVYCHRQDRLVCTDPEVRQGVDMKINRKLSEVADGFTLLEPGLYLFRVEEAKESFANGGETKVDVRFRVLGRVNPDTSEITPEGAGGTFWQTIYNRESTMWLTKQVVAALGFSLDDDSVDTDEWPNKTGLAQLEINSYTKDGVEKKNNRPAAFLPRDRYLAVVGEDEAKLPGNQGRTPVAAAPAGSGKKNLW